MIFYRLLSSESSVPIGKELKSKKGTDLFFYSKAGRGVRIRVSKINLSPFLCFSFSFFFFVSRRHCEVIPVTVIAAIVGGHWASFLDGSAAAEGDKVDGALGAGDDAVLAKLEARLVILACLGDELNGRWVAVAVLDHVADIDQYWLVGGDHEFVVAQSISLHGFGVRGGGHADYLILVVLSLHVQHIGGSPENVALLGVVGARDDIAHQPAIHPVIEVGLAGFSGDIGGELFGRGVDAQARAGGWIVLGRFGFVVQIGLVVAAAAEQQSAGGEHEPFHRATSFLGVM